MALVLDTGPLLAALNQRDQDHAACRKLLEEFPEQPVILAPALVELDYWVTQRMPPDAFLRVLDDIEAELFAVIDLHEEDYPRVRQVQSQYADARVGFVDAAVLAIVERLNEPKLATLDQRHFGMLRPVHVDALELLPPLS